jgi:hypothetical protein
LHLWLLWYGLVFKVLYQYCKTLNGVLIQQASKNCYSNNWRTYRTLVYMTRTNWRTYCTNKETKLQNLKKNNENAPWKVHELQNLQINHVWRQGKITLATKIKKSLIWFNSQMPTLLFMYITINQPPYKGATHIFGPFSTATSQSTRWTSVLGLMHICFRSAT